LSAALGYWCGELFSSIASLSAARRRGTFVDLAFLYNADTGALFWASGGGRLCSAWGTYVLVQLHVIFWCVKGRNQYFEVRQDIEE
jgi:hypothetical protein